MKEACRGGHIDIVRLLIRTDVASGWDSGLIQACRAGYMEIVKLLIQNGTNQWGPGMVHACENGHKEIVELMIRNGGVFGISVWLENAGVDI
jgi:ankyrin repeat protein